jgi:2-polyprenyl-3-methyl-5-hydroxy-6-metoxy-1,4-benzoquinol methylase
MNKYKETQDTWDKLSEIYQEKFSAIELYNSSYNTVLEKCEANSVILDLACASGIISQYINKQRADIQCDLLDSSPKMIELAKTKVNHRNSYVLSLTEISKLKEKYDAIFCGFGIPFIDKYDLIDYFNNSKNLLKSNGLLYLSYVYSESDYSEVKTNDLGSVKFHYYSEETINGIININSFIKTHEFEIKYPKSENQIELHKALILSI